MEDNIINETTNIEEELAKLLLANGLNGPNIIASIKIKETEPYRGEYVMLSGVKKNKKNFCIPISKVKDYLEKTYNEGKKLNNFEDAKQCVEKLLHSIYNEIGPRFLGFDGICGYFGTKIDNLPTFDINNTVEKNLIDNIFSCITIGSNNEFYKRSKNKDFKDIVLNFDTKKYSVNNYPISYNKQTKISNELEELADYSISSDSNNYVILKDKEGEEINVIAPFVNRNTLNKGIKYCSGCNFVKKLCGTKKYYADMFIISKINKETYRKPSFNCEDINEIINNNKKSK